VENSAVALFRSNIMMALLDIIMENVPELTALDLSDTNLCACDSLIGLVVRKFIISESFTLVEAR
jgi:hypothetical protein